MSYPEDFVLWVSQCNWSGRMSPKTKTTFTLMTHRGYPEVSLDVLWWYYLFLICSNV